ncbi:hypothetical protein HHL03_12000 [Acinetobacter pittii]|uniref:Uncharacterized protein n=2 Tax=Acinetobacter calcoaceticus/baumannii complex TaxID=909768 RepID=A0A429J5A4_ACIPI|nr:MULTISPECIES: hypothetical protein [Acinetobacter]KCX62687.1 hypothetical protein J541_1541 [Acinetobacter pittii]MBJ8490959.1 hypothetical protein [Acinetobacter pittii]MBK1446486.1 hypothetical protein [Acinetobacter pittii]MCG9502580.1 hypothetical protein [Acinetobacter pittii]MCU4429147.1 hypothetical protein [Acinetobacter pittii]
MSKKLKIESLYNEFLNNDDYKKLENETNARKVEIFLSEKIHRQVLPYFSQIGAHYRIDDYYLIIDPLDSPDIENKSEFLNWLEKSITEKHLLTRRDL